MPLLAVAKVTCWQRLTLHLLPRLCLACREKELAAVKVTQADIDVIAAEAEVDKKLAERRLREHNGNLLEALRSFL